MRLRRRNLRNGLVAVGCLVAVASPAGSVVEGPGGQARIAAAFALLAFGSALHFWSKGCLEQNQRLVTNGPYRFTRNPFYLANGLIDLGLCALIGRVWVVLPYALLWWLAYRDTILREETRLEALFPGEFERYVAAVPRLIPTGRSLPRSEAAGQFTLANPALAQGSEYARIAGVWVAAATIGAWAWIRGNRLGIFAAPNTAAFGWVALVPVAWVLKLAIGEVFRDPGTALLPFHAEPARRRVVTFALVAGLYAAARIVDPPPHSTTASIAFVLMIGALALLPTANALPRRRGFLHLGLAAAIAVFSLSRGVLWIASVPLLWVGFAALDDRATVRRSGASEIEGEGAGRADRKLWPAFPAIAGGALASLLLVAAARFVAS